jgi:hypothetical protein
MRINYLIGKNQEISVEENEQKKFMKLRICILFKDLFTRRKIQRSYSWPVKKKTIEIISNISKPTLYHFKYFKLFWKSSQMKI